MRDAGKGGSSWTFVLTADRCSGGGIVLEDHSVWARRALIVGLVCWGSVTAGLPVGAQETAPIPEPDITYYGSAPAGSQVSIQHAAGLLGSDAAGAAAPYVLTVKLVQPVVTPRPALPPAGSAYVADQATVLVDGVAQGRVNLAERGAIYRLDFPNPAKTPSPNAILTPVLVIPSVPPFSCGQSACTPTPSVPATVTPTATRTETGGITTRTPSRTVTPTGTPTPTVETQVCVADCGGDDEVTVDELVQSVNILLENAAVESCAIADLNDNGKVAVDEVRTAVRKALVGCAPGAP